MIKKDKYRKITVRDSRSSILKTSRSGVVRWLKSTASILLNEIKFNISENREKVWKNSLVIIRDKFSQWGIIKKSEFTRLGSDRQVSSSSHRFIPWSRMKKFLNKILCRNFFQHSMSNVGCFFSFAPSASFIVKRVGREASSQGHWNLSF